MNATRTIYNGHTANWPVLIFSVALSVPLVVIALANGAALLSNLLVASLIALYWS